MIPVLFVLYSRDQKADLAKALRAVGTIDDQKEVLQRYRREGIFTVEVSRGFNLSSHKDEIFKLLCDQVGIQPVRDCQPKGVLRSAVNQ